MCLAIGGIGVIVSNLIPARLLNSLSLVGYRHVPLVVIIGIIIPVPCSEDK